MSSGEPSALALGGQLVAGRLGEVHTALLARLGAGGDVRVDAGGVEGIDASGFQLLVAFRQAVEGQGRRCTWVRVSEVCAHAARRLGLERLVFGPQTDDARGAP